MRDHFATAARVTSRMLGTPKAFAVAVAIVVLWAATGPIFGFSDTWQLVINTGTTIVTFLMVFLIQNTQNRDALAMHLKLDELIQSMEGARDRLIGLEESTEGELDELHEEFQKVVEEEVSVEVSEKDESDGSKSKTVQTKKSTRQR
ncbi:MAG TPA: low affinity iron permease family protein [Tepidiformaceae bacterium]